MTDVKAALRELRQHIVFDLEGDLSRAEFDAMLQRAEIALAIAENPEFVLSAINHPETRAAHKHTAIRSARGVTRDDDPRVGEPARSAAWREWKSTREFFNYNTTEQHAALNFAAGFKAGVRAASGVKENVNG